MKGENNQSCPAGLLILLLFFSLIHTNSEFACNCNSMEYHFFELWKINNIKPNEADLCENMYVCVSLSLKASPVKPCFSVPSILNGLCYCPLELSFLLSLPSLLLKKKTKHSSYSWPVFFPLLQ